VGLLAIVARHLDLDGAGESALTTSGEHEESELLAEASVVPRQVLSVE
jgi:hypothetical protein